MNIKRSIKVCNSVILHTGEKKMAKASKKATNIKDEIKLRKVKIKKQINKINKLKKALKKAA
jgi:hypothetical protein